MLPDQRFHSTLIQAFDPVRFSHDRVNEAQRIMEARTEVLLNLLFGREIVLPAGQVAESPAIAAIYREVMAAFDRLTPARRAKVRTRPFRIALEHGYHDYTDYVARYVDVGAPIVQLPLPELRRQEERAAGLALVKRLYIEKNYDTLEQIIGRPGFAEYARLVHTYLDTQALTRPVAHAASPPDLLAVVRQRIDALRAVKQEAFLDEINEALPFFAQSGDFRTYRGLWYAHADRFGASWDIVRHWLDHSLYMNLTRYYDVQHPVFTTQELARDRYTAQDILMPADIVPGMDPAPIEIGAVDWISIWEIIADGDFQRSLSKMTQAIAGASLSNHLRDSVEEHAKVLNAALSALQLDLSRGKLVLQKKAGDVAPIVAGTLVGSLLFPIIVGAFIPVPDVGVGAAIGTVGTLIGAGVGAIVSRESQFFAVRTAKAAADANQATVTKAVEHIIAVTRRSSWATPGLSTGVPTERLANA